MRKIIYIVIAFLVILAGSWFYANHLIRSNLVRMINNDPGRTYNFTFGSISASAFSGDVILRHVRIEPLTDTIGTLMTARVTRAEMNNVDLIALLTGKNLDIGRLIFLEPEFNIKITGKDDDDEEDEEHSGMQKLFGDILSRGRITEFVIRNGSMRATRPEFGTKDFFMVENYNLVANEIETDSVQWDHQVPFKMGSFSSSMDSVVFRIDENTVATTGLISYSSTSDEFLICNAAVLNDSDLKNMSLKRKEQADIFEVSFDTLSITGIKAGNDFYGDMDIKASNMKLIGLVFADFRNKNLPRPPDQARSMFSGIINSVPVNFEIDTILISDAIVQYTELENGRSRPGSVTLSDIDMRITDLSTISKTRNSEFRVDLSCMLNGSGKVLSSITVPYDEDKFIMNLVIRDLDARVLTRTTEPILGVDISSGNIKHLNFTMNANTKSSQNYLVFQYEELRILLNDPEMHKTHQGLISHIANSAIRTSNLSEGKNYKVASYTSIRDPNRGPFNFIWSSLKDGIVQIVPTRSAKKIMEFEKRKQEKRKGKK